MYNDCKYLTFSANSAPARVLTSRLSEIRFKTALGTESGEGTSSVTPYIPDPRQIHHLCCPTYNEILNIIADSERKRLKVALQNCIKFCVMVDGSCDLKQQDIKYVMVRYIEPTDVLQIITAFVAAVVPEADGAPGLLEGVEVAFEVIELPLKTVKDKFAGCTTDGEAANTGKKKGLCALLRNTLGIELLCYWCACHRADLVTEEMIEAVDQLKQWKGHITLRKANCKVAKPCWYQKYPERIR